MIFNVCVLTLNIRFQKEHISFLHTSFQNGRSNSQPSQNEPRLKKTQTHHNPWSDVSASDDMTRFITHCVSI